MSQLLQDIRYGIRMLWKSPGFTAVAVAVLALGSGANTAVFSVLNAVVLRPPPYSDPARLYRIESMTSRGPSSFSAPDLATWRERTQVFEKMAAGEQCSRILSGVDEPEQLLGVSVERDCLPLLGTPPIVGRWFSDEDFGPGGAKAVIIGQRLWQRRFHGDPNVLGKPILLDGAGHTVIGIMPPEFQFTDRRCEFWIPLQFSSEQLSSRDWPSCTVYARAKAGATWLQVEAETGMISRTLVQQFPKEHKNWRATVTPLRETIVGDARPTLVLLLGAVASVLMIACLNVANLLLARGTERSKEVAVRAALGAGRLRIVRQLLTESLLLALMGGFLGLLLAGWANRGLVALFWQRAALPRLEQTGIDGRVLGFTLMVAIAGSVLFGLVPALQASKLNLSETLKETGRSGTGGVRSRRLQNIIMVAETALSLLLLAGAGLMLRSFYNLIRINPGFKADHVLTARLPMPAYRVPDEKRQPAYYMEILRSVQRLPGVQSAGLATVLPLTGGEAIMAIRTTHDNGEVEDREYYFRAVSPDYFRAMGIPFKMGRDFTDADSADAPRVAIVNETLARQLWPSEYPIGKKLTAPKMPTVVGVVGDIRHTKLSAPPHAELYMPCLQYLGTPNSMLVVRPASDPMHMVDGIRKAIRQFEPDQPIVDLRTMEQVVSDSVAQPRFYTLLLGVFAGLAVVLAATGVYGVMSYSVSQQQHEIGIRMALGAQNRKIVGEFVSRGLRYVLVGIAIGLAAALAATRLLSTLLFEVEQTDPATYAFVSLFLLAWTVAAIWAPARRATRVDPLVALRHE